MDQKQAESYKRALKKVSKTKDAVLDAKGDDLVSAVEAHEKAKASLGRLITKINASD